MNKLKKGLFLFGLLILAIIVILFFTLIVWGLSGGNDFTGFERYLFFGRDEFYVGTGQPYEKRIPLIKPYELVNFSDSAKWKIGLHERHSDNDNLYYYGALTEIKEFTIVEGILFLHTDVADSNMYSVKWLVIDTVKKKELGFETELEFLEYCRKAGLKNYQWYYPDKVYKLFSSTGCLDWIRDCFSNKSK